MPDPAEQLQRLYLAGFELQTFDRFPKCVGVVRDHCIALLVPSVDGLQMLGTPGWRMGEAIGVLTEKEGRPVFQAKQELVDATPERLEMLRSFRADLQTILARPILTPGTPQAMMVKLDRCWRSWATLCLWALSIARNSTP